MNQKLLIRTLLVLILVEFSFQQTFGDVIKLKQCDNKPINEDLSSQILYFMSQYLQPLQFFWQLYYYSTAQILYIGFVNQRKFSGKLAFFSQFKPLKKALITLPQYYIINELHSKDNKCESKIFEQLIGYNYSECKLCTGKYFEIEAQNVPSLLEKVPEIQYDKDTNLLLLPDDGLNYQELMVQSFQYLWNCNNPQDKIEVTSIFDDKTKEKLKTLSLKGFKTAFSCGNCEMGCKLCHENKSECVTCIEGYTKVYSWCVKCTIKNCLQCSKYFSKDYVLIETCQACKQGFVLYNQTCVLCPTGTLNKNGVCVVCQESTYFNGESCINCSQYCKNCSGPYGEQCEKCHVGFLKQNSQCVRCKDESTCLDGVLYPFLCSQCHPSCKTCSDFGPMNCTSCTEEYKLIKGRCFSIQYKPSTYIDSLTGEIKQCNFSCQECIDSTNRCLECNLDQNYYVKDEDKKICYNKCPIYYVTNDQDQSQDFYECKLSNLYSDAQRQVDKILLEAQQRCPDYTFWDIDSSSCKNCTNKCLSCTSRDICSECAPGYYWDEQQLMCFICHNSCKKCYGPLFSQCNLCKDTSKMYPNSQGVCDASALSQPLKISNVVSISEIFGDLKQCLFSFSDKLNKLYSFKILQNFSTLNSQWKEIDLISTDTTCTFDNFKQTYNSLKDNPTNCDGKINISKMWTKGQMTVIYSILLNQSGVKIEGKDVSPYTLAQYAKINKKYLTHYIYKPKGKFSCNRLFCESHLENFINGLDGGQNQKVKIKQIDQIDFTSNGSYLNCHLPVIPSYDKEPLKELEVTVSQAKLTINTDSKIYFLLNICVTGSDGKQSKKIFLASDFYEKGFVSALDVESETDDGKYNQFFVQGASKEQNDYLKKCNTQYKNKYLSYLVVSVQKIEVLHENTLVDKEQSYSDQIAQKNNLDSIVKLQKNYVCVPTRDYILQNEDQGGELQRVISPQDTILTKSIKVNNIIDILKKNKIDPVKMKAHKIQISILQTFKFFEEYISQITNTAFLCYGINSSSNQCIQNVFIDIVFSNNGQCIDTTNLKNAISKSLYVDIIKLIQASSYCSQQKDRCNKHIQVLKSLK